MMELFVLAFFIGLIVLFILRFTKSRHSSGTPIKGEGSKQNENLPKRFRSGIRGTARGVETKRLSEGKMGHLDHLAFRLEVIDSDGNVKELIPVETKAREISGKIKEGDTIVVSGKRNRKGLFIPKGIYNESTHLVLEIKGFTLFGTTLGCLLGVLFTASVFGLIAGGILAMDNDPTNGILLLIVSAIVMIISIYITNKKRPG